MIEVPERHKLELRNALQSILDFESCPLEQQPGRIEQLGRETPHSIKLVDEIPPSQTGERPLSCHAFTFDLLDAPRLVTPQGAPIVPSAEFVVYMIGGLLSTSFLPNEGDIVVYFEKEPMRQGATLDAIMHSGRWRSGRVHSKWGIGHVWRHEIFEVPSSYGCVAGFYQALTAAQYRAAWEIYSQRFR